MTDRTKEPLRDGHGNIIETVELPPEQEAARKRRARFTALSLVAFIALIFVVTLVRLTSNFNSGV
jgi:hypothetical protein